MTSDVFLCIFDLPTYPNQRVYYISLFSKIRRSLTYLPTQKSDVIFECSLIKKMSTVKVVQLRILINENQSQKHPNDLCHKKLSFQVEFAHFENMVLISTYFYSKNTTILSCTLIYQIIVQQILLFFGLHKPTQPYQDLCLY